MLPNIWLKIYSQRLHSSPLNDMGLQVWNTRAHLYRFFFFLVYTCHTICSWLNLWMWNCKYRRLTIKLYTISDCVGVWVCVGTGVISTPHLHIVQGSIVLCTAKNQNKTKTQPSISSLLSDFNFLKCAYSLSWTQSETSTVLLSDGLWLG